VLPCKPRAAECFAGFNTVLNQSIMSEINMNSYYGILNGYCENRTRPNPYTFCHTRTKLASKHSLCNTLLVRSTISLQSMLQSETLRTTGEKCLTLCGTCVLTTFAYTLQRKELSTFNLKSVSRQCVLQMKHNWNVESLDWLGMIDIQVEPLI